MNPVAHLIVENVFKTSFILIVVQISSKKKAFPLF